METDDNVVREIDVYFSNPESESQSSQLCLLQYPLRPPWRPYDEEGIKEVRVSSNGGLEMDFEVDQNSENYDRDADPALLKKTQTLASRPLPMSTTYAIGVLVRNELYINKIDAVYQLRPKTSVNNHLAPEFLDEAPTVSSNEQNSAETWLPLEYHGKNSTTSADCLKCMVRRNEIPIQFSMSRSDYVNKLCSITPDGDKGSKGLLERISPTVKGPWEECLRNWLIEGLPPIHNFAALRHIAPDVSEEKFLEVLRKHAVLVQGLWVPRTHLYEGTDVIQRECRDYILSLFSENNVIKYSELPTKPQLLLSMEAELRKFAIERSMLGGWKFKVGTDSKFIKEHRQIERQETEAWKEVRETTSKFFYPNSSSTGVDTRMQMPHETRQALTRALQKLFHTRKVCRADQIHQHLRELAESIEAKGFKEVLIAALGGGNLSNELQAVISEVCVDIHGVYVLRSSPDNPKLDGFRQVVIDLLRAGVPNAKIQKAAIKQAVKEKLNMDIKEYEYKKVVSELCVYKSSGWELKSEDGH